jgi:hypothetical protein
MFRSFQAITLLSACVVGGLVPSLKADEKDKRTLITLNEPVVVEDVLLKPGEYVLKLAESVADPRIVEIFNRDETHLIGTVMGIPAYRLNPADREEFTFYVEPSGQPEAMHTWFYPGDNIGIEFVAPKGTPSEESDSH